MLGDTLKSLDGAIDGVAARALREGREPTQDELEMVASSAASCFGMRSQRYRSSEPDDYTGYARREVRKAMDRMLAKT